MSKPRGIEQLIQRNEKLKACLAKNSRNSRKPPFSDPPLNRPKPKSLRTSSGKPRGGQTGHRGASRAQFDDPDQGIVMGLTGHNATAGTAAQRLPPWCSPSAARSSS